MLYASESCNLLIIIANYSSRSKKVITCGLRHGMGLGLELLTVKKKAKEEKASLFCSLGRKPQACWYVQDRAMAGADGRWISREGHGVPRRHGRARAVWPTVPGLWLAGPAHRARG